MVSRRGEISREVYEAKLASKMQTPEGYEIPDPTPIEPPLGYVRQPSITERIRDMVRSEHLRQAAEAAGAETFEEADDFEVDDDLEPISGYENDDIFEPAIPVEEGAAAPADKSATGVPPPGGGGKGGGEPIEEPEEPAAGSEAPPAPLPAKPAKSSPKRS